MSRPRAILRFLLRLTKWATLAAALLVVGVWAGGKWTIWARWQSAHGPQVSLIGVPGGVIVWINEPALGSGVQHFVGLALRSRPSWMWALSTKEPPLGGTFRWGRSQSTLSIPYWLLTITLAVCAGLLDRHDRRVLRSMRIKAGCCPACGYSLAGLAAGSQCPECGKAKV
jgi:hypothetical protein